VANDTFLGEIVLFLMLKTIFFLSTVKFGSHKIIWEVTSLECLSVSAYKVVTKWNVATILKFGNISHKMKIKQLVVSGVTDGGAGVRAAPAGRLNVKMGYPVSLYFGI